MPYRTHRRQAVADLFEKNKNRHLTAEDAERILKSEGVSLGTTTVYRALEQLVRDGKIRKHVADSAPACYQWVDRCEHTDCYHLICTECGKLTHLTCAETDRLFEHIFREHGFLSDRSRTSFYGICADCRAKIEENDPNGNRNGDNR